MRCKTVHQLQTATKRTITMSKNLSLKKETLVSLQSVDLDQVIGGVAQPTSSARPPVAHPTSSAHPGPVAHPTSSAHPGGTVSSVRPGGTVSSVRPGGGSLSSVLPNHKVSSAKPNF
jgi:hypothetical protein